MKRRDISKYLGKLIVVRKNKVLVLTRVVVTGINIINIPGTIKAGENITFTMNISEDVLTGQQTE